MRPIIIAHRGASHLAPENTLAAFRLAKRLGADGIECDVQLTKDHQLVIAHDYFTDDHAGVKGDIYDMTLAELRQLDFGKWKSPEYEGEKIPTLDEVLEVGRDMQMLHIELKPYLDRDADFPERVVEAVCNAHMEDKVVLTSFQYGLLGRIKEIRPEIKTAALFLNTESSLCPPTVLWEDLGLRADDPLVQQLSGPQGIETAAAIVEDPGTLEEENRMLVRYLNDRLTALFSNYPGKNLLEILQQYYYQTDMLRYVSQFDFPLDYVGPEYHVCFRDTTLLRRAVEMGYHVAPWPVGGDESRRDLRSVLLQNPEILVTNKPEIALAILEGQKLQ